MGKCGPSRANFPNDQGLQAFYNTKSASSPQPAEHGGATGM